jgi:endonuclease/exonuclease/phosphatase family metal-dependent hydrolase
MPDGNAKQNAMGSNDGTASVRVLTLNMCLNSFRRLGCLRIPFHGYPERRLAAAPELLRALEADIIALQEVNVPADRRHLANSLEASHPFSISSPRRHSLVGNGLMFLSRFPILTADFIPYDRAPLGTRLLREPGFLAAEIDLPAVGSTRFINAHLAANVPFHHPEAAASKAYRSREIAELLAAASAGTQAAVLIGDFNTSPEICPENYHQIISAGYIDAFAASNLASEVARAVTWDSANALNIASRFKDSPSQRIDHVFVPRTCVRTFAPAAAEVVLQEEDVTISPSRQVTLSDHYGMLVTFTLLPQAMHCITTQRVPSLLHKSETRGWSTST